MDEQKQKQGTSLLKTTLKQGKRLLKTEMDLARQDLKEDAKHTAKGSLLLGASAWMGLTSLSALVIAMALAVPKRPERGVLFTGLALLGGSLATGLAGLRTLPSKPLGRSREGLQTIASTLGEKLSH
jgi:hypothetical protein